MVSLETKGKKIMEENEKAREERQEFDLTASDEAVEYLSTISEEDWDLLILSETLVTTSEKDSGEFKITVTRGEWHSKNCCVVHVTEETLRDTVSRVINIIAHVDQSFTILEQSIHEYLKMPDKSTDKKTLMVLEGGKYIVQRTVIQEDFEKKTYETYSIKQLRGFISEGCHVLVQRLLLKNGIPDNMVFLTFDSEVNLSKMTFQTLEEKEVEVGDQCVTTIGIQSKILSLLEPEETWNSYFLNDGRLILRSKVGSEVAFRRLRLPRPLTPEKPEEIPPLKWEEDMQLFSEFIDRKEELMDDHNTYIRRHPELHALLADFLQFVLLRKPDDVFEFAKDFFGGMSLAPNKLDQ